MPFILFIHIIPFIHTTKLVQPYTSYIDTHIKFYKYHYGIRNYQDLQI